MLANGPLAAVHKESKKPAEELTNRAGHGRSGRRGRPCGEAKLRQPPSEIVRGGFGHPTQKLGIGSGPGIACGDAGRLLFGKGMELLTLAVGQCPMMD